VVTTWICVTCGTQYPESVAAPERCPICDDERQYLGWEGQRWTTPAELFLSHWNEVRPEEPGLFGIGTTPAFAIGQRALLVQSPGGNLLFDCVSLLDRATVAWVKALGGLRAIAVSHPHYYSAMADWARALGVPIYLHEAERRWVMRPDPAIEFWSGETLALWDDLTLVRLGGHFAGGQVLHWPAGAEGRGALLTGDVIQVVQDRRWVSFMYSYPNLIPLPAAVVRRIADTVAGYRFDRIYGAWWGKVVRGDARAAVIRSARRYVASLERTDV